MLFNSLRFMLFFPAVTLVYFLVPKKWQWVWLLVVSYIFYMGWNPGYVLLLALSTAVTFVCGALIQKAGEQQDVPEAKIHAQKRAALVLCLIINFGILFFFKYYGFFAQNIASLGQVMGLSVRIPTFDVLLPVGISFYTFQAVGYTIDVYRGEVMAEKNLFRYALFVSFFPQLVAGPIERTANLLPQLEKPHAFSYHRARQGLALMLWGYFLKMVIADRLAILVNGAFAQYHQQGGAVLVLAIVFFAFQVYCDFAGYSTIAKGAARVMGVELMDNFKQPYLATSLQDFWRRWHISLSTWLGDYLFTPLVWSRWTQKLPLIGKHIQAPPKNASLMVTFLASGLWHGANWTYVVWGGLHGAYQVVGNWLAKPKKKLYGTLRIPKGSAWFRLGQTCFVFFLVCFSYVFFRAASLSQAFAYLGQIVSAPFWAGDVLATGMNLPNLVLSGLLIIFLSVVDKLSYTRSMFSRVEALHPVIRAAIYMAGLLFIIVFGMYGEGYVEKPFIYFQF